jgi:D-alanyl-D-alanine carboxypeptidase
MFRACVGASRGLRWAILALSTAFLLVSIGTDPADARSRRRVKHTQTKHNTYSPPYSAIVVDHNSGRVLHATNPDSSRHPASITKIMTLYLLFEQLEAGKLKLDTELPVSSHASVQAPSKLYLRPGQSIAVEDAIKALVTKSANDVAVVVAEAIAGDEEEFAKLMTRKARALGMTRTVYANASGLPDDEQITTARDQALLGRAIQDRFPRYYRYFSTSSFYFRGHAIRNHNRLLGRVAGVDGIKTGFINKSGFNLVTSVRRGNRHLVAVVIGGKSGSARDARMRALIEENIGEGATERTAAKIVEGASAQAQAKPATTPGIGLHLPRAEPASRVESVTRAEPAPYAVDPARPDSTPLPAAPARPTPGSTEPIAAVPVRTLTVRAANTVQNAAMTALSLAAAGGGQVPAAPPAAASPASAAAPAAAPAAAAAPRQYHTASAAAVPVATAPAAKPAAPGAPPARPASVPASEPQQTAAISAAPKVRAGWIIQIGAFPDEGEARERLESARTIAKGILGHADPFTERVTKGRETLYRARFAGLNERRAEAACKYFKRNNIDCFAVKN